jgi:O-antigen/teichoic acid export membrane protein
MPASLLKVLAAFSQKLLAREFVRWLAATMLNWGAVFILGTAASIMLARGLGPQARGEYAYITNMLLMAGQFCLLGLHSANAVFVSRNPENGAALLGNSLLVSALLGLAAFTALLTWDSLFSRVLPLQALPFIFCIVLLQPAALSLRNLALGLRGLKAYNLAESLPAALRALCIAAVFFAGRMSIVFLLFLLAAVTIFGLGIALKGVLDKLPDKRPRLSLNLLRSCLSYGWRIYLVCLIGEFITRAEILMAGGRLPDAQLGQYAVAYSVFVVALVPVQIAANLLLPKLAGAAKKDRLAKTSLALGWAAPGILLLIGVLYLFTPWLMNLCFGPSYEESGRLFRLLLPGYAPFCFSSLILSYINTENPPLMLILGQAAAAAGKALILLFWLEMSMENLAITNSVFQFIIFFVVAAAAYQRAPARS